MKIGGLVLGFGLAALAQILAFFLAGVGHGWVAPFFLSAGLWFLIPLTLALVRTEAPNRPVMLLLVAIALASDALLVERALAEETYISRYVQVNGAIGILIIGVWLCLWFSWQAMVARSLLVRRNG